MKELAGKVAVVTGAASGIGKALSQTFAAQKMSVVMSDIEADALERAAKEVRDEGVEVLEVVTDVSVTESVNELAEKTFEKFGTAHVVCNNAGVAMGGVTWQLPNSQWDWVLGVNLWGVINGIRAFMPKMVEQNEGHIVNTGSMSSLLPIPFSAPYTVTKHAVLGLSEAIHYELLMMGSDAKISILCPSWVATNLASAGRNWPERLGDNPNSFNPESGAGQMAEYLISNGADPMDIAKAVVDGILEERFWILPHDDQGEQVLNRFRAAVNGEQPPINLTP